MFICEKCGKTAPPNTRCVRIIAKRTVVEHPFRPRANRMKKEDNKGIVRWEDVPDKGGEGVQTVKEMKVCVNCAPSLQDAEPSNP